MGEKSQKTELDNIDIQILCILQENCRLSLRKLSDKMGISDVMAASRIKKLKDMGIVKGYTVILDPVKLGFDLTAVIFIQTDGGYIKNLENELSQMFNVIALYEITGDFDAVAVVKLRDRDSLNILLENLLATPHIKKTMTNVALNIAKEDYRIKLIILDNS